MLQSTTWNSAKIGKRTLIYSLIEGTSHGVFVGDFGLRVVCIPPAASSYQQYRCIHPC